MVYAYHVLACAVPVSVQDVAVASLYIIHAHVQLNFQIIHVHLSVVLYGESSEAGGY